MKDADFSLFTVHLLRLSLHIIKTLCSLFRAADQKVNVQWYNRKHLHSWTFYKFTAFKNSFAQIIAKANITSFIVKHQSLVTDQPVGLNVQLVKNVMASGLNRNVLLIVFSVMRLEWKVKDFRETEQTKTEKQKSSSTALKQIYPWSSFGLHDFYSSEVRWSKLKVELDFVIWSESLILFQFWSSWSNRKCYSRCT